MSFFVVATPIGNLKDITLRALDILRGVDVIVAEDTRVTKKLLAHYNISKPLISYREQVHHSAFKKITGLLNQGKNIALVTDAGTPGISDPGGYLVRELAMDFPDLEIVPIPGASALVSAVSVSGIHGNEFLFLGYPPAKKGRKKFFEAVKASKYPVVLYESPHRIIKTLQELCDIGLSMFDMVLVVEISKVYEKIIRKKIVGVLSDLKKEKKVRGEFALVINKKK